MAALYYLVSDLTWNLVLGNFSQALPYQSVVCCPVLMKLVNKSLKSPILNIDILTYYLLAYQPKALIHANTEALKRPQKFSYFRTIS